MPIEGKFGLVIGTLADNLRGKMPLLASALDEIQTQVNKLFRLIDEFSETDLTLKDVTTGDVTSTAHGFAPKSPADATLYLNGAAVPAYTNPQTPWNQDIDANEVNLADLRSLSFLTVDTTIAPAIKQRQVNGGGAYGYDYDVEDVAVGYLELFCVVAGTRSRAYRLLRDNRNWIFSMPTSAPSDANMFNGSGSFWYDEGASQIKIKVKSSGGTVKNGTVVTVA